MMSKNFTITYFGYKKIPPAFSVISIAYLVYCLLYTPNLLVSIPVVLFPAFAYKLFWIDKKPNVIFWSMMLQWLSASTQLLYCNILQISLEERFRNSPFPGGNMDTATLLSLIALYVFSLGFYYATRTLAIKNIDIDNYKPGRVLIVYAIVSAIVYVTSGIIWSYPAIVQYVYFFFYIKWGFFLVTFYVVHRKARSLRIYLYSLIGIEVVLSFSSFFAGNFINIVSYTLIAFIALQPKLNTRSYLIGGIASMLLLHFMIIWSAIKPDYRSYISKGQTVQIALVTREEANAKFYQLVNDVDEKKYAIGIEKLVDRLGYIQFFGATLNYVPNVVPFQEGKIYKQAILNYLTPRFFFPDKPVLDDSKHTTKYTGIGVNGIADATSFSLGYVADAYIDFGPVYMFPALLVLGYFFGLTYKYFVRSAPNEFWVWISTGAFFLLVNIYGTDTNKAIGWMLIYFLTVAALQKVLINLIDPFMKYESKS